MADRKLANQPPDTKKDGSAEDAGLVIGVRVASEAHQSDRRYDVCLGVIVLKKETHIPLQVVRQEICSQLHCPHGSFSFLTFQGWPVNFEQETLINLSQITPPDVSYVCIQRFYGKPRVGVVTNDNRPMGFVFIDVTCLLSDLREAINEQISNLINYSFIDRNGWPISTSQEPLLLIVDLLKESTVQVQLHGSMLPALPSCSRDICRKAEIQTGCRRPISALMYSNLNQLTQSLSFQHAIDKERPTSPVPVKPKAQQILISYVRAEAADHAVRLKSCLMKLGYSVYLDVHEIKSGVDWQDALNSAVSTCKVFVPLVTPRYGETQWTNREVKLADVLAKFILPVSFLNHWPPKCLAIQFATTQYIPWKSEETIHKEQEKGVKSADNICVWAESHIRKVAKEIAERIKAASKTMNKMASNGQLCKRISTLRSCPVPLPDELNQLLKHRDGQPLVVISLHPAENRFGQYLSRLLEGDGFEVWLSTEVLNCRDNMTGLCSQRSLEKCPTVCLTNSQGATITLDSVASPTTPIHDVLSERLRRFQEKADEAGIIVWVVSKEFADSKMTREQVFYCERRKRMIPVLYEDVQMPGWMSMLIGTQRFEDARSSDFEDSIKARIRKVFDSSPLEDLKEDEVNEEKLSAEVQILKEKIAVISQNTVDNSEKEYQGRTVFVYVSGSVRFYSSISEAICKSIGVHLARLDGVQMVTGGFFGVGETVGRSYYSECMESGRPSNIWHILPTKDSQDQSRKGRQNPDKTFAEVPYGRTVFIGDSVRERESITSRAFDICILVEGGPGAAYEAQQFAWNDHVVVPIRSTGGAAGGNFNLPDKIFELPTGVSKGDWDALGDPALPADAVGLAVANIVGSVRDRLALDSPNFNLEGEMPRLKSQDSSNSLFNISPMNDTDEETKSPRKKRLKWLSTDGEQVEFTDSD